MCHLLDFRWRFVLFGTIIGLIAFLGAGCCRVNRLSEASPATNQFQRSTNITEDDLAGRSPLLRGQLEDVKTATTNFLKRVRAHHSSKELREWALAALNSHIAAAAPVTISATELPVFILELDPPLRPTVTLIPKSHLSIDWGGGWGHWGLLVGPPQFQVSNPRLYVLEWEPGIFAYGSR